MNTVTFGVTKGPVNNAIAPLQDTVKAIYLSVDDLNNYIS